MTGVDNVAALITSERLPPDYRAIVEMYWRPLAAKISDWRKDKGRPLVVGVNGAQGSGKSTACVFLEKALLPELGLNAATLLLDDFYLSKADRQDLAERVHPLFITRGVPGTHDAAWLARAIDDLIAGRDTEAPVFDKARDDRASHTRTIEAPVDVILLEGWCVGAVAQPDELLKAPANALERDEDSGCAWRRYVNEQLGGDYRDLFSRIDRLVMLRVSGMEAVLQNRLRQERKLRAARPDAKEVMGDAAVARFVQHYERLTRWQLETLPQRADIVIDVDGLMR
ncbi:MAG: hypothetical protein R3C58_07430 [Parvularculaceae bacterium]